MYSRLRALRRISQFVFWVGFLVLFAFAAYPLKTPIPVDLYLRADPLIAISTMLSLRAFIVSLFWFALPIVVLSILFGRIFCGWICPTGTTIDICERVLRIRRKRSAGQGRWRRVKFYLLLAFLVTMLVPAAFQSRAEFGLRHTAGLSAVYVLDPIALLTRTLTWVALPVTQWSVQMTNATLTGWTYSDFVSNNPWADRLLSPFATAVSGYVRPAHFRLGLLTLLVFAGIIALGRYESRFWCRNLCPLGALLGWLGRLSPIRFAVSNKCTRCLRCVNECKVGAITENPDEYRGPECIHCYNCLAICPEQAISIIAGYDQIARRDELELDRRRVLGAALAGLAAVAIPRAALSAKPTDATEGVLKISSNRLIRPPGSRAEPEFVTACVRCGECMKVCPTNTLQPAVGEGGLEALGTPIIVPRVGQCAQPCDLCGRVCPTRAIEPFRVEEKEHLYLGTASVNRSMCIAWAKDRECLVCDEACPYDAISQQVIDGLGRPVVDERICVGCGMCEWVCPVEPLGAIRVDSSGDKRHLTRAEQQSLRALAEEQSDVSSPYPNL